MKYLVLLALLGCGTEQPADIDVTHYFYKECSYFEECACPDSLCGDDFCDPRIGHCSCTVIAANCDEGGCALLGDVCPAED